MNEGKAAEAGSRRKLSSYVSYALIAGSVLLAWQVAIQPFAQRAPPSLALRIAPGSPSVLGRAAETELAAGRLDNAEALSRAALKRSPFDVRALRVLGLSKAGAGQTALADDILTLAGNWSLRDDPSHAWLVESRLRRGDYGSALAHADTLARRREDIQPQIFNLFTVSGVQDPRRGLPVVANLLAANPPWRQAYISSLGETPEELQLVVNLAILLEGSDAPLTDYELEQLYGRLVRGEQFNALRTLRQRIGRPTVRASVVNGDFSDAAPPMPFQWRLLQAAGIASEITTEDSDPSNLALRVEYDGYATGTVALQLLFLSPGVHTFTASAMTEASNAEGRLAWKLTCAVGSAVLGSVSYKPDMQTSSAPHWSRQTGRFEVPVTCPAQWLRLETEAADHRSPMVVWFDNVSVQNVR